MKTMIIQKKCMNLIIIKKKCDKLSDIVSLYMRTDQIFISDMF